MNIPAKIRILIADDHEMIRHTWKLLLEQDPRFLVVGECDNSEQLTSLLKENFPDVILLDINIGPTNGYETTRTIMQRWPMARIIGLSINNQSVYAKNLLVLGAKGYVTKDSSRYEMTDAIIEVMKGNEYICKDVRKNQRNFLFRK